MIAPIIENVRRKSIAVAREHVCQICNRTFNTEKRFIKHMEKHPKEFQCEHCSVKTYYLYALKSHIRNEHNDKHNK